MMLRFHENNTLAIYSEIARQCGTEDSLADTMRASADADISCIFISPSPIAHLYINPDDIYYNFGRYYLRGNQQLPAGLISDDDMGSLHIMLARVLALHEMLKAGVPITIFCPSVTRHRADGQEGFVDDTQLKRVQRRYPHLLQIISIPQNSYQHLMPSAVYFINGEVKPFSPPSTHQIFLPHVGTLCREHGIDFPRAPAERRVYLHSIYSNYWERHSLWKTLISVSKQALQTSVAFSHDIYNNMSAAAFYLGRFQEAETYAKNAGTVSEHLHPETKCRALYLQSAACRATNHFDEAVALATESLDLYQESKLQNKHLLAKIYFNLLAAYMDDPHSTLPEDRIRILAGYTIDLFNHLSEPVEAARVHIRMANYYLKKQDRPDRARTHLNCVCDEVKNGYSRVTGHYELARGRLLIARDDEIGAKTAFSRAMEIAQELDASADYDRAKKEKDLLTEEPIVSVRRLFK